MRPVTAKIHEHSQAAYGVRDLTIMREKAPHRVTLVNLSSRGTPAN